MLEILGSNSLDLILVEGFRHEPFKKIEVYRPALKRDLLAATDTSIIAIAADAPMVETPGLPHFDLNEVAAIENFVLSLMTPVTSS